MGTEEINKRYCQSCGMPLRFDVEEYLGTNPDNSRSDEFCYYCLNNGEYIVDIPMSEMVDIWVKYTDKYNEYSGTNYTSQELRTVLNKRLPTLNRWKQKQETQSLHYQSIQKVTSYINEHLFEILNMNSLILMSGLSKFYFRRVFKAVKAENIAAYIRRLRIEQIANLLISTSYTLDQIAAQTRYNSKSGLAKAFRRHFGVSTSVYRKKYSLKTVYESMNLYPDIKIITDLNAHCLETGGTYINKSKYKFKWSRISHYAKQNKVDRSCSTYISISLDDPLITPTDKCRFYLGVTVPKGMKPKSGFCILAIPDGRYAVFKHKGDYASLYKLYQNIYEVWFPQSNYQPKGTMTFEIYLNNPKTTKAAKLETEVYIPIKKML